MKRIYEQEFIAAYDQYAEPLFRYCYLKVYDRERARELMQDTFMKAWTYLAKGNEIGHMRAFLYRVAHNVCVNEVLRKKTISLDELAETVHFDPADDQLPSPETAAESALLMERLAELPEADRELLALRYMEGLPVSEIAEIAGERPNTVSVRIHRALKRLQDASGTTYE